MERAVAVRFVVFDRWGAQLATLTDVLSAEWAEELNGEDTVSIEALWPLAKGQRVVWRDAWGDWHEHTVASVTQSHDSDGPVVYSATCENSISELYGDYIMDKRPENQTASYSLTEAIRGSRWAVGTVDVTGTNSVNFYRESCRECVQKVVETWGGELWTSIAVSGCAVTSRKVNLSRRGSDNGRRFEWGADMEGIKRTFDADDVVTALYGFGKGEEVGDGHGRGIDFASINGGRMYVYDSEALAVWGRPNGSGKAHVFGKVEFSDCDDPTDLKRLTQEELDRRKVPKVSYEASVLVFLSYGYDFRNVGIGDDVALVDRAFSPEVRVKGRVTRIARDLLDEGRATDITIGNIIEDAADMMAAQYAELKSLGSRATSWDVAAYTPSAYIQQVMDGLNKEFDEGASYIYQSPEQGIIVGSVPLNPVTGRPSRTPATAIQLKGGGFRIASGVKSNGDWNWRTFGTGAGFTADEINLGSIKGGANSWNLSTGDLVFKQGSITIDGPSNTQVRISASEGFKVYQNGSFIGGIEVVSGKAHLRAARCGTSATNYVTTGTTQAGNPGASFVNGYGNYCDIEALRAIDDTSNATTGMGMACFDWPWLNVSRYYKHVIVHPPTGKANDYMVFPGRRLSLSDTQAIVQWSDSCYFGIGPNFMNMRWSANRGLFFNNDETCLMHDSSHYVRITGSRIEFRCGSKGGGFDASGEWKEWVWS